MRKSLAIMGLGMALTAPLSSVALADDDSFRNNVRDITVTSGNQVTPPTLNISEDHVTSVEFVSKDGYPLEITHVVSGRKLGVSHDGSKLFVRENKDADDEDNTNLAVDLEGFKSPVIMNVNDVGGGIFSDDSDADSLVIVHTDRWR